MAQATRSRRSGGRARAKEAQNTPVRAPNYRQLRHPFHPQDMFSEDEVASIHDTALRVLEELGIKILLPEALHLLRSRSPRSTPTGRKPMRKAR